MTTLRAVARTNGSSCSNGENMASYSANLSGTSSDRDTNADGAYRRRPGRRKRTRIMSAEPAVLGDAE